MNSEILVLTNIVPLFGLIYLAVVILDRQALNRKERALFQILWTMEMLDLLADNTQTVMAALPYPTAVRIAAAAVSYSDCSCISSKEYTEKQTVSAGSGNDRRCGFLFRTVF